MLNFILDWGTLLLILISLFVLGGIVGSFLNVWIARLSREKSVIWPLGSRCGNCFQAIRWYDKLPIISYWILRGRCRTCKTAFSIRYFYVELFMACAFPALFYLEIVDNIHGIPGLNNAIHDLRYGIFTRANLPYFVFFLHRAVLLSLLVTCAGCDLQFRTIPLPLTICGTIIGLIFAVSCPWPWPSQPHQSLPVEPREMMEPGVQTEWWLMPAKRPPKFDEPNLKSGLYPWPVWGPLPSWLRPGSARLGLLTGLAGALAGTFLLRAVRFLFERGFRREALGLGDADLMMMVGAFLGWQPVLIAFLLGGLVSLLIGVPGLLLRGENEIPFGPGLAIGTLITWLTWEWLGQHLAVLLFHPTILGAFILGCGAVLLLLSFVMGLIRGPAPTSGAEKS